ncbi:bis(5'-nucleosyl)-tetraphosphatase PrpE [asymmetrical]-like [Tachypleus tridentatus]|uniref:bis(5'-nucleosyl)-tetraphosphatase PrpE [asymmetrical]-like n=1 Tax=Tachypleus tridentatus TaxID=6853 RepID=UPI003FD549C2
MAALVSFILSLFRNSTRNHFIHVFGLRFPPVLHKIVSENFIKKFEEVFVIGDVHGCFDELTELLEKADVATDNCLKIFVGDLVNKGPKSLEVVRLLRNKANSTLCVRGNHDEVVLELYHKKVSGEHDLTKHSAWINEFSEEDIDYLQNLPYTITLPSLNVIVVHAGLVPGLPMKRQDPRHMVTMRNLVIKDYFWEGGIQATNSNQEGEPWGSLWPGPEHVYFGHDARRLLQLYSYATGLDTGCVYGKELTGVFIAGPRMGTFVSVTARHMYEKPKG